MSDAPLAEEPRCPDCEPQSPNATRFCAFCGRALAPTRSEFQPFSEMSGETSVRSIRPAPSTFPAEDRGSEPAHFADPLIGRTVAERYRILEQIGRGGTGVVYRVEHAQIGKLMALKLLSGELTRDRVQVARFKREALMASQLSHPNTVQVFDYGNADGLVYLAMEYLRGEDLGRIIRREGALGVERTLKLMIQVASSLCEAHEKGIVHRDLKPENMLMLRGPSGEEVVKVLDFGLAKLRESSELSDVTTHGSIVGTPYYMSPEQIRGESADPASDIYSLGALIYICLTGTPVFDAATPLGVFTRHLLELPVAPHLRRPDLDIPETLSRLVLWTLEKEAQKRPPSVAEFRERLIEQLRSGGQASFDHLLSSGELKKLTDHDADAATRSEVEQYERKLRRRGRVTLGLFAAAGCGLLSVIAVLLAPLFRAPTVEGREREPNDSASEANAVPFGVSVEARIGQRIDRERSDRDFFSIVVPARTPAVRLTTTGLPNMALCTLVYPKGSDSPVGRYCTGTPGQDLLVQQLALSPGPYVLAVMQDRDVYTKAGPPPVYENVSDDYRLQLTALEPDPSHELEPNDSARNPAVIPVPGNLTAQLSFMRDVDVVCATAPGKLRFTVEDGVERPRPREAVLEVMPLAGPDQNVPVRVHALARGFKASARDTVSPWRGEIPSNGSNVCLQLTLVPNPWLPTVPPEVAPASDGTYSVHAEAR